MHRTIEISDPQKTYLLVDTERCATFVRERRYLAISIFVFSRTRLHVAAAAAAVINVSVCDEMFDGFVWVNKYVVCG